jgi:cytidylate kinase
MAVITISHMDGCGERAIGQNVAEVLGWPFVNKQIIDQEVEKTGFTRPEVTYLDEHAPSFFERLERRRHADAYFHALAEIMHEFAAGNGVILGRGGNFILRGIDALHVRLVAAMAFRVHQVQTERMCNPEPARAFIAESDRSRAAFMRHYFRADWNDPLLYDMTFNVSYLGQDRVVELLLAAARSKWPGQSTDMLSAP